jgi:lipopolysaccharide transport system permease protein
MSSNMSASATTKIPVSEMTTFHASSESPSGASAKPHAGEPAGDRFELIIQPSQGWIGVDWGELWRFRELLYFLIWRDVKVRYKQAALGIGWAVLEPVLNMVVFTAIMGYGLGMSQRLPSDVPFAIFVFSGLIVWKLFATALNMGGMSLVNSQNLLTKIYFPRLFVPTATVGSAMVDMGLQFLVLGGVMAYYHFVPSWQIVFLPLLVVLTMIMSLGAAYLLSALTVTFRDFRFLIPVMVQVWMWMSFVPFPVPAGYLTHPKWQYLLAANPMFSIIAAFRKCVTGYGPEMGFKPLFLVISAVSACALFTLGLFYFRKTEKRFADIA